MLLKKASHRGAKCRFVVVKNMNASFLFLGGFGFGFTLLASLNKLLSSSSSYSRGGEGGGGGGGGGGGEEGVVFLERMAFVDGLVLCLESNEEGVVFGFGMDLVNLVGKIWVMAAAEEVVEEGERGVEMVKRMARGRQRRRAQRREMGLGESMVVVVVWGEGG